MMNLESVTKIEPKFVQFDCKDFEGVVSYLWANSPVEFKYYNHVLAPIIEKICDLERKWLLFRGTSMDRLKYVIAQGCTSEVPNEGFWGTPSLEKAMEYGHLILCYDYRKVEKSCKTFKIDLLSENDLFELRKKYKSVEISQDKKHIFCSMFNPNQRGKVHYEREYGYYIPGNEIQALKRIIILGGGSEEDLYKTISLFKESGGSLQLNGKELFTP